MGEAGQGGEEGRIGRYGRCLQRSGWEGKWGRGVKKQAREGYGDLGDGEGASKQGSRVWGGREVQQAVVLRAWWAPERPAEPVGQEQDWR